MTEICLIFRPSVFVWFVPCHLRKGRGLSVFEFFDRKITDRKIETCARLENLPVFQSSCPMFVRPFLCLSWFLLSLNSLKDDSIMLLIERRRQRGCALRGETARVMRMTAPCGCGWRAIR